MIRSEIDESPEFEIVKDYDHIQIVMAQLLKRLPEYFKNFMYKIDNDYSHLGKNTASRFHVFIKDKLGDFENARIKYQELLSNENMEDYGTVIGQFKDVLKKECPIITHCMYSKAESMKDWKIKFKCAESADFYNVFSNIIDFCEDYCSDYPSHLERINPSSWEKLDLEEIDDENYHIFGVIGTGIISTIMHELHPEFFAGYFKKGMYSLFFISGKDEFACKCKLPSRTSEFTMIQDMDKDGHIITKSLKQDHNFFYSYALYSYYTLVLYQQLKISLDKLNIMLSDDIRFDFMGIFYDYVNEYHNSDFESMLCQNDLERKSYVQH